MLLFSEGRSHKANTRWMVKWRGYCSRGVPHKESDRKNMEAYVKKYAVHDTQKAQLDAVVRAQSDGTAKRVALQVRVTRLPVTP